MHALAISAFLLFGSIAVTSASSALYLTPYIRSNNTETARNLSKVNPQLFLNVTSHSGFLTVDEKYNSNMFFWYFPVKNLTVTKETPWILWLQGGPGATSLTGLFSEIGPFKYDEKSSRLLPRYWTWNRNYPLLFIDNPVGAGFSFTDSEGGFVENMDQCAKNLYSALQQFLEVFPELRKAPLYLAGESYAGHHLPAFGRRILHRKPKEAEINLKGIMMGNPMIDRRDIVNMTTMYYMWGLIDSQGVEAVRPLQEEYAQAVQDGKEQEALHARDKLWDSLQNRAAQPQSYNVLREQIDETDSFKNFLERRDVLDAMHVGDIRFTFSNASVHTHLVKDFLVSFNSEVEELLEHYRVMIYCGQLDLVAPCTLCAEARRKNWRWSGRGAFLKSPRVPWYKNGVAGYVKSGGNFTEVLVRGAGHLVPMDKPEETFELVDFFIRGLDLPRPSNYEDNLNDTPAYLPLAVFPTKTNTRNSGLIASVVLNVLFVAIILAGVILAVRWKRRADTFFYSTVDNESLNGVLTMD